MYESEVAQSCPTLCDPMDCSLPGSSVHGTFQARILEWAAISFSKESSQPRDRTQASCIVGRRFTVWAIREFYNMYSVQFSRLVISNSLRPRELQHARPPSPLPTPGVGVSLECCSSWGHKESDWVTELNWSIYSKRHLRLLSFNMY